jgi:hypothetical protein
MVAHLTPKPALPEMCPGKTFRFSRRFTARFAASAVLDGKNFTEADGLI